MVTSEVILNTLSVVWNVCGRKNSTTINKVSTLESCYLQGCVIMKSNNINNFLCELTQNAQKSRRVKYIYDGP